jgi:uncharacterized protein YoxC
MPAPEDRLNVLEHNFKQFKTDTIRAYQDLASELSMIAGLTDNTIGRLRTLSDNMNSRFDWTDQRFDTLNQQVYDLGQDVKAVRQDMNSRFETTNQQIAEVRQDMNSRFDQVLNALTALATKLDQQQSQ